MLVLRFHKKIFQYIFLVENIALYTLLQLSFIFWQDEEKKPKHLLRFLVNTLPYFAENFSFIFKYLFKINISILTLLTFFFERKKVALQVLGNDKYWQIFYEIMGFNIFF